MNGLFWAIVSNSIKGSFVHIAKVKQYWFPGLLRASNPPFNRPSSFFRSQNEWPDGDRGPLPKVWPGLDKVTKYLSSYWKIYRKYLVKWRTRQDSNLWPLPSEGSALSSWATGALNHVCDLQDQCPLRNHRSSICWFILLGSLRNADGLLYGRRVWLFKLLIALGLGGWMWAVQSGRIWISDDEIWASF